MDLRPVSYSYNTPLWWESRNPSPWENVACIDFSANYSIHSLINLIHNSIVMHLFMPAFIHSCLPSLLHSFIHSFIHLSIHPSIHPFIHPSYQNYSPCSTLPTWTGLHPKTVKPNPSLPLGTMTCGFGSKDQINYTNLLHPNVFNRVNSQ